jgi:UDP-N-acetylmuramyl pentapeptide phosphotransferase/UDP-N-acetylglucosamine-1-phosphate transferase
VVTEIIIGVVVLALLIYRQLRSRPVNASGLRLAAIIGVIGLVEAYQFVEKHHAGAVIYAALLGSLALAAVFGVLRAATVRLWLQDGQPWSQGSWVTASLWIVAVAAHLGYDALVAGHGRANVGDATIVLYLAVSLGVQRLLVHQRAQRLQRAQGRQYGSGWSGSGSGSVQNPDGLGNLGG